MSSDENEIDRQEYNCAVANGLIVKARSIARRMQARCDCSPLNRGGQHHESCAVLNEGKT